MHYVYVLQNPNGLLYKGQTQDLSQRLFEHNDPSGPPSFTRGKGPWTLVYEEKCNTRSEAMKREKFLKSGKGRDFLNEVLKGSR